MYNHNLMFITQLCIDNYMSFTKQSINHLFKTIRCNTITFWLSPITNHLWPASRKYCKNNQVVIVVVLCLNYWKKCDETKFPPRKTRDLTIQFINRFSSVSSYGIYTTYIIYIWWHNEPRLRVSTTPTGCLRSRDSCQHHNKYTYNQIPI